MVSTVKSLAAQYCAQPLCLKAYLCVKRIVRLLHLLVDTNSIDDCVGLGAHLQSKRVGQSHKTMDIMKIKSRCFFEFV